MKIVIQLGELHQLPGGLNELKGYGLIKTMPNAARGNSWDAAQLEIRAGHGLDLRLPTPGGEAAPPGVTQINCLWRLHRKSAFRPGLRTRRRRGPDAHRPRAEAARQQLNCFFRGWGGRALQPCILARRGWNSRQPAGRRGNTQTGVHNAQYPPPAPPTS
jgi:hypothetical protein